MKTYVRVRVSVRVSVQVSVLVSARVSVRVSVRVSASVRPGVQAQLPASLLATPWQHSAMLVSPHQYPRPAARCKRNDDEKQVSYYYSAPAAVQ